MNDAQPATLAIRQAGIEDTAVVSSILQEAARWLEERGMALWRTGELAPDLIAADVAAGLFVIAEVEGTPAGVMMFQLSDPLFWPDVPPDESCFLHRLGVRRRYAGGAVSSALLQWAVEETRRRGRKYLRLDCLADRPRLRAIYERFGFRYHSDWQFRIYHVARYEYPVR